MLTRLLGDLLSPMGRRAALSVLIFHRVLAEPDPLYPDEPDARRFDTLLGWLSRSFNVLPLDRAVRELGAGTLPARAAAITFDDGYHDNFSVAMPLLRKHGLTATFFIATGFLDGGRMWNDTVAEAVRGFTGEHLDLNAVGLGSFPVRDWNEKRLAIRALLPRLKHLPLDERLARAEAVAARCAVELPADLMMSSEQVKQMRAAGMAIGAHTQNHPILARLDDAHAREEIAGSKHRLESLLDERVTLFAYPNGKPSQDYLPAHVAMVLDAGFDAAVSTAVGAARRGADMMQLPRFTPWDRTELRFGLRLLDNLRKPGRTV